MNKYFFKSGFIKIDDYLNSIFDFLKKNEWRLPLSFLYYLYLISLKVYVKISPIGSDFYIKNASYFSPGYTILVKYLLKNKILDEVFISQSGIGGFYKFNAVHRFPQKLEDDYKSIVCSGSDDNVEIALSKCLGEMLERKISCLDVGFKNVTLSSTYQNMLDKKLKAYWPTKHHEYTKDNMQNDSRLYNDKTDEDKVFRWTSGHNLSTYKKVYIPHQLVFWRHSLDKKTFNEPILHDLTSNGCAGYFDKDTAIKNALQEVVQRDAFLCHWLCKVSPDIIDKNTLPVDLKLMINKIEAIGLKITILNITTDINIPSVCIYTETCNVENKMLSVTAGTSTNYYKAIKAGLKESLICTGNMYRGNNEQDPKRVRVNNEKSQIDRIKMYLYKENIDKIKWFIQGKTVAYKDTENNFNFNNSKIELTHMVKILKNIGSEYEPICYEYKDKVLSKLGFHVVRVFIEKCFPFYLYENNNTKNSARLTDFCKYKNIKLKTLNTNPHPFP